jgi:hypothetical protein
VNRIAIVALVVVGCRATGWRDDRATEVVVGPYTVPIPAGWRNLSEARDQTLGLKGVADGYTVLVPERYAVEGKGPVIAMNWIMATRSPNQAIDCPGLAKVAGKVGDASEGHAIQIDGDDGCLIRHTDATLVTVGALRFHGDAQFLVLCTHDKAGDPDADAACASVFASLHIPKS